MCVCSEWAVNIQRDSYASYIGHYPLLGFFAIAENESIGRERYSFMQVHFFSLPFVIIDRCVYTLMCVVSIWLVHALLPSTSN